VLRNVALVMMLALPAAAAAQGGGHGARAAGPRGTAAAPASSTLGVPVPRLGAPFPPIGAPFPPIGAPFSRLGVPFPPIGLPLAPIGLGRTAQTNRHVRYWPFERGIEHRQHLGFYGWPAVVYYVSQPAIQIAVPAPPTEPPVLEVPLDAAQVAVAAPPAPPPPVPVTHKTFYIIAGCYLGDVPPKDAGLPPTCDVAKTRTFQP
jgi:hypothetical protein